MTGAVLIIKLGAFGDFVQAAGPFTAIRRHHSGAKITLLTTAPFTDFAEAAPWFDHVWQDARPRVIEIAGWLKLRKMLRSGFSRIYDLQTSERSGYYYRLIRPGQRPEWSGIASGCSHPHANPDRDFMHTLERQREQLEIAGIEEFPNPDWSWVPPNVSQFDLGNRYALLVPGGASHRLAKRWPIKRFVELARYMVANGIQPVVLGSVGERVLAAEIILAEPDARDLTGVTNLTDVLALAAGAATAVGNDTGPMHAAAVRGCPSVVLFSKESDPKLCAPRGDRVEILARHDLVSLSLDEVVTALPV